MGACKCAAMWDGVAIVLPLIAPHGKSGGEEKQNKFIESAQTFQRAK